MNMVNASVKQLITFAYDVRESQLMGGPNWLESQRYDIIAKAPPSEGPTDPRQMTSDQREILAATNARTRSRSPCGPIPTDHSPGNERDSDLCACPRKERIENSTLKWNSRVLDTACSFVAVK